MFDLTPQERRALIFILATASLGFAYDLFSKNNSYLRSWVSAQEAPKLLDLNAAGKEELMRLPGIGEKLASRILERRRENGNFTSSEELKEIKGITAPKYEKLRDSVLPQ